MKRTVAKNRRFGPGEFAGLAKQCMDAISKGDDVFALLASKGIDDPVNEWYDIRRWVKSNDPGMYAQIPMNLRLELPAHPAGTPVKRVNTKVDDSWKQADSILKEEADDDTDLLNQKTEETASAEPKRRPGRPPRAKVEEKPIQEKKPRKASQKPKESVSLKVGSLFGRDVKYSMYGEGIRIEILDNAHRNNEDVLLVRADELRNLAAEIPAVLKAMGV